MNPFCIITITISLKSSDFFKTFKTVTNQKNKNFFYIIVASKADNYDIQKVEKILNDNNIKYKIIGNKDSSLYNAMNLGLDSAMHLPTLFLNSGDLFLNDNCSDLIQKKIIKNKLNCFSVVNSFDNYSGYIRKSSSKKFANRIVRCICYLLKIEELIERLPPHQGLVFNYNQRIKYRFSENAGYHADTILIQNLIDNHDTQYFNEPITIFNLGGMSSKPSLRRYINHKNRFNSYSALFELIKLILFKMIGPKTYYSLVNIAAGNKFVDLKKI